MRRHACKLLFATKRGSAAAQAVGIGRTSGSLLEHNAEEFMVVSEVQRVLIRTQFGRRTGGLVGIFITVALACWLPAPLHTSAPRLVTTAAAAVSAAPRAPRARVS